MSEQLEQKFSTKGIAFARDTTKDWTNCYNFCSHLKPMHSVHFCYCVDVQLIVCKPKFLWSFCQQCILLFYRDYCLRFTPKQVCIKQEILF